MFATLDSYYRQYNDEDDIIKNMIKWFSLPETRFGIECICSDKFIELVEQYSKDNFIKTRQSELLKMFPNVEIDEEGVAIICPARIDTNFKCRVNNAKCSQCCKDYWSEKIE